MIAGQSLSIGRLCFVDLLGFPSTRSWTVPRPREHRTGTEQAAHGRHGQADRGLDWCRPADKHGRLSTVDGPFTETKEVIGGYAILEAKSKDEAIELTRRFLKVHGDEWDIECEVRQLDGPEFGREAQPLIGNHAGAADERRPVLTIAGE